MCITFFGFNVHPKIRFFLLFNRDEFLNRPTVPFKIYDDCLIYSLDELTGGTFLCFNLKNGNFGCLLNSPFKENPYSSTVKFKRGMLPIEFCKEENYENFFTKLIENKKEYNGFNLLCGNVLKKQLFYFTNNETYNSKSIMMPISLDPFIIHSIENTWMFNEIFATKYGKEMIKNILESLCQNTHFNNEILINSLINVMSDDTVDPTPGLDFNNQKVVMHSSIFKHHFKSLNNETLFYEFGTRQTIGIIMDQDNNIYIVEYHKKVKMDEILNKLITIPNDDIITKFEVKI